MLSDAGAIHRVRRLSLRVRVASTARALELRQELRRSLESALPQTLERVFDGCVGSDRVVHLRRLELHFTFSLSDSAGADWPARIAAELPARIAAELPARIAAQLPARSSAELPASISVAWSADGEPEGGIAPWVRGSSPASRSAVRRGAGSTFEAAAASAAQRGLAQGPTPQARPGAGGASGLDTPAPQQPSELLPAVFFEYLQSGRVPWFLANSSRAHALSLLRQAALEGASALPAARPAARPFQSEIGRWLRWLQLIPETEWVSLARGASASSSSESAVEIIGALLAEPAALGPRARVLLVAAALAAVNGAATRAELEAVFAEALAMASAARSPAAAASEPARATLGPPQQSADPEPRAVSGASPNVRASSERDRSGAHREPAHDAPAAATGDPLPLLQSLPEPARRALESWLASASSLAASASPADSAASSRHSTELGSQRRSGAFDAAPARTSSGRDLPFGEPACHAGLILLHPFLSRFFAATGILREPSGALRSSDLPRAAALLHRLASEEAELFEFELDFIKLLLGVRPEVELLASGGLLSSTDEAEVEGLLAAVLEHWSALKKTSTRGLKSSFLARRGWWREEAPGLRLRVEPAAFDVLLAQLPWGVSTVKLPWMPQPMFTEWAPP